MAVPLEALALIRGLAAFGLPAPVDTRPLGRPRVHETWLLRFPPGARLEAAVLRVVAHNPGEDTLATERAALRLAALGGLVPVPREYALLAPRLVGRPAAVRSFIPGVPGTALLEGAQAPAALAALGEVIGALQDGFQVGFATRATAAGSFVPRRACWAEEVIALALERAALARAGADLGPLSAALLRPLLEGAAAMESVTEFALVHGDLHPGNTLFQADEAGCTLQGVIDWERAGVGDPVAEWATPLLLLPPPALAWVLRGYGVARAAALLDPEVRVRLGLYARLKLLDRLAWAALPVYDAAGARPRAQALELARSLAAPVLAEDGAGRLLEAALRLAEGRPVVPVPAAWGRWPASAAVLARQALIALAGAPPPDEQETLLAMGAIACALRAARSSGAEAEAAARLGERLLLHPPLQSRAVPSDGPADPAGWRSALRSAALASAEVAPARCLALPLLALALDAIDLLAGAVPGRCLDALETASRALMRRAEVQRSSSCAPQERLVAAVLGAWALGRLGLEAPTLAATLAAQRLAALDELSGLGEPRSPALAEDFRPSSAPEALLPVVLLAIQDAPSDGPAVWAALAPR